MLGVRFSAILLIWGISNSFSQTLTEEQLNRIYPLDEVAGVTDPRGRDLNPFNDYINEAPPPPAERRESTNRERRETGQSYQTVTRPHGGAAVNYYTLLSQIQAAGNLNLLMPNILSACHLFTVQREMGTTTNIFDTRGNPSGQSQNPDGQVVQITESNMTISEIDTYEAKITEMCQTLADGRAWVLEAGESLRSDGTPRFDGGSAGDSSTRPPKDIFLFTLDQCTTVMGSSMSDSCRRRVAEFNQDNTRVSAELNSCIDDLRSQCADFVLQGSNQTTPFVSRDLIGKCDYQDQTTAIEVRCKSYCHSRNVCEISPQNYQNNTVGTGYENRQIADVYLIDYNGNRRPCNKNSTFGITDGNKLWSAYNCDANFAVKYKEPRCGFRPHCPATPHLAFEPIRGTQTVEVECDGVQSLDGQDYYCQLIPKRASQLTGVSDPESADYIGFETLNGEKTYLTNEADLEKDVTSVTNIKLVEQLGAARCNLAEDPTKEQTYASGVDPSSGKIGVKVRKNCNGRFEVSYEWEFKRCSYAGEVVDREALCCQGLVGQEIADMPGKFVCNAPNPALLASSPQIQEFQKVESFFDGLESVCTNKEDLEPELRRFDSENIGPLFDEIGRYELLTAYLGRDSQIVRLSQDPRQNNPQVLAPQLAMYDLLEHLHNGFTFLRADVLRIRRDLAAAMNLAKSDFELFVNHQRRKMNGENVGAMPQTTDNAEGIRVFKEKLGFRLEQNIYFGRDAAGDVAPLLVEIQKRINVYFDTEMANLFDAYSAKMAQASQLAFNFVWLCAHSDTCSTRGWMINQGGIDGGIIDFYHDPVFAYGEGIEPRVMNLNIPVLAEVHSISDIDRNGNGKKDDLIDYPVKKYLISQDQIQQFERSLSTIDGYKKFYSYHNGEERQMSGAALGGETILGMFRKFSVEFPLRAESALANDQELKDYYALDGSSGTAKAEIDRLNIFYCQQQDEIPGWQVRVPYGKALLMYRLAKVAQAVAQYSKRRMAFNYFISDKCLGNQGSPSDFGNRIENTPKGITFEGGPNSAALNSPSRVSLGKNPLSLNGFSSTISTQESGTSSSTSTKDSTGQSGGTVNGGASLFAAIKSAHERAVTRRLASNDPTLKPHLSSLDNVIALSNPVVSQRSQKSFEATTSGSGSGLFGNLNAAPLAGTADAKNTSVPISSLSSLKNGYTGNSSREQNSARPGFNYRPLAIQPGNGADSVQEEQKQATAQEESIADKALKSNLGTDLGLDGGLFDLISKRYRRTALPILLDKQ